MLAKRSHSATPPMMLASSNNQAFTPPIFTIAANLQQGSFSMAPTNFSVQPTISSSVAPACEMQLASLPSVSAGFTSAMQKCTAINTQFTQATFVPMHFSIANAQVNDHQQNGAATSSHDVTMEVAVNTTSYSVSGTKQIPIAPHININLRLGPRGVMQAHYAMAAVDGVYRGIVESGEFVKDCLVIGFRKDLREVFGPARANPWIAQSKQNMQYKLDGMKNLGVMLGKSIASVTAGNTAARMKLLGVNNGVVSHFENTSLSLMNDAYQRSGYEEFCQLSPYEKVARVTQFLTGLALPYFVNKAVGACINKHRYGSFRKPPFFQNTIDDLVFLRQQSVNIDKNFIKNFPEYAQKNPLYDITHVFDTTGQEWMFKNRRIFSNGKKHFFYHTEKKALELMYNIDPDLGKALLSTGIPDGSTISTLIKHPNYFNSDIICSTAWIWFAVVILLLKKLDSGALLLGAGNCAGFGAFSAIPTANKSPSIRVKAQSLI